MMVALWAGSFVLAFFGITLAALRVAGGLVVALSGWRLLNAPETHEERKQQQAVSAEGVEDIALLEYRTRWPLFAGRAQRSSFSPPPTTAS